MKTFIPKTDDAEKAYTREGMDSKSIIPWGFMEELKDKKPEEKHKYEVGVRKWQFKSREKIKDKDGFYYLKVFYSIDKGLQFKEKATSVIQL